jgi:hypothetical protein
MKQLMELLIVDLISKPASSLFAVEVQVIYLCLFSFIKINKYRYTCSRVKGYKNKYFRVTTLSISFFFYLFYYGIPSHYVFVAVKILSWYVKALLGE